MGRPRQPSLRRLICACAAALLAAATGRGLDWPVASTVVTGTFGEDRGDHFHAGIDIGGGEQEVRPVLPGELVFRYDEGEGWTSLPRGTGSFVALRHSQNIITLYCHLAPGSLGAPRARYGAEDRLGVIGETGHANGKHLHFAVFDAEAGSYLNPLGFLPPVADRQAPVIRRVILAAGDQRQVLQNGAVARPGAAEVLVEANDLREDVRFSWPMAPYGVSVTLDGVQAARIVFDTLLTRDGGTVLSAGAARGAVYADDGALRCGTVDLRPGASRLRVTARDFAGNESVRDISFTVGP
jgi:hypothetical protein